MPNRTWTTYPSPNAVDSGRPSSTFLGAMALGLQPITNTTPRFLSILEFPDEFATEEEAIELANTHGYGLSGSIYTTNPQHAFRFRERVSAGMVSVNNSTSGAEAHLPFGGNGKSGNGARQSGIWVLDQVTRWQSMNWDFSGKLQKAQMDVGGVEADLDFRL